MRLIKSTSIVTGMTLVSRISGLLRDQVSAVMFGASAATDAFYVAFRIPNLLRRLFAEGSFSLAFVPVLAEYRRRGDHAAVKDLIDHVAGTLCAVLLALVGIGVLLAPLVVSLFAWGLREDPPSFALATDMLRITMPYALFISLVALAAGILNTWQRFAIPALTPVLLNLSMIACALLLAPTLVVPVTALAWGVLIAGVVQLGFQVPSLWRLGLLPRPRWGWRHPGVQRILKLMLPTLFGASAAQINLLFDTLVATLLLAGSVTWLYYADRLLEFPLGLLGVALGTVILPHLSARKADADALGFSAALDWALRLALLVAVPAAAGLMLLATPMLATLFQYREFTAEDTRMAALALIALGSGLPAFIAVKVLAPGYYARQDTRTPVRYAVLSLGTNMLLTALMLGAFVAWAVAQGQNWRAALDTPGLHAVLALTSALAGMLNAGMLLRGLLRTGVYRPAPGWRRHLLRLAAATLLMAAVLLALRWLWPDWGDESALDRAVRLATMLLAGGLSYALALLALGLRPRELLDRPARA